VPERSRLWPYLALALLALALFLPGQAALPPLDRDESRYAQATTQMLESGNFLDIRFQNEARYLQPAGIYWLQAASVSLFSAPEAREIWAYRIPSLIGATLAVLLTAWVGNLLFGAPAGWLAAVLMAASLILGVEARMAKIDATLLAAVLVAQAALAKAYLDRDADRPTSRWAAAAFWAALGVGLMLKGPIILLVTGGTILLLGVVERRVRWLRRLRPSWGILLMLAIVLPWCIGIAVVSDGAFFTQAVGHNLLGKVATGQQAHGAPPGYYLALFPITFWPGVLFAVLAAPFVWLNRRLPAVRFCLCWIAPTWIVFELIATKLPHYVLPTYPAIACLAAAAMAPGEGFTGRWRGWLFWPTAAVWLAIGLVLASGPTALVWWMQGTVSLPGVAAALVAALLMLAAIRLLRRGRAEGAVAATVGAALLVFPSAYAYELPQLDTIWLSPRIAAAVERARPCPGTTLATTPYDEPSLVFLLGTDTKLVDVRGAAAHLLHDPACALVLVGAKERDAFLSLTAAGGLQPRAVARIRGVNYSNGKRVDLTLYAGSPAGAAPAIRNGAR
jgi:4-amino-4-deoxy-L-arabinose transferase-like glycosyltransferase